MCESAELSCTDGFGFLAGVDLPKSNKERSKYVAWVTESENETTHTALPTDAFLFCALVWAFSNSRSSSMSDRPRRTAAGLVFRAEKSYS